ncbi:hypothetical protein B0H10DRAFT_2221121 [Mycena sp. CBHHK59/15]|nr:hypothetical protein B0H10DRAFT_2221121 [Mycena sp. CBHHK59/15]
MLRDITNTICTWIEKSKQPAEPTTTLQALVNLCCPSLCLTPLANTDAPHRHIFLSSSYPNAHTHTPADLACLCVFKITAPSSFGKTLTAADAAIIELACFEHSAMTPTPSTPPPAPTTAPTTEPAPPLAPQPGCSQGWHRGQVPTTAGPALAIVKPDADKHDADSVKITICLVVLNAAGCELDSPNKQTIYLEHASTTERTCTHGSRSSHGPAVKC